MRRVERHQRREAVAPIGDAFEHLGVSREISLVHDEVGTDRAGIRQRLAEADAVTRRGLVERMDEQCIGVLDDDDLRLALRRSAGEGQLSFDPIDGQARQPQAEDPSPVR